MEVTTRGDTLYVESTNADRVSWALAILYGTLSTLIALASLGVAIIGLRSRQADTALTLDSPVVEAQSTAGSAEDTASRHSDVNSSLQGVALVRHERMASHGVD